MLINWGKKCMSQHHIRQTSYQKQICVCVCVWVPKLNIRETMHVTASHKPWLKQNIWSICCKKQAQFIINIKCVIWIIPWYYRANDIKALLMVLGTLSNYLTIIYEIVLYNRWCTYESININPCHYKHCKSPMDISLWNKCFIYCINI